MEKINFNENRNLSEIIRASFRFIKLEGRALLRFYSWFVLPLFIPIVFLTYQSDLHIISEVVNTDPSQLEEVLATLHWRNLWFAILGRVIMWLVFLSVTLVYLRNYCMNDNKKLSNKDMWNEMFYEFPKIFIVQFFYLGMIMLGLVTFIIPGIYFGVSLALATTIVVFEDSKIFHGLRKSFKLIGTKWFMNLGYLSIFYLVYFVLGTALQFPFSIISNNIIGPGEMSKMSFAVIATLNLIISMLASAFPIIGTVFLYYILMQPKESLSESK